MGQTIIKTATRKQSGDLVFGIYAPLYNIIDNGEIKSFTLSNESSLNLDMNHPVTIDAQESYDGTVNLILNDDKNPPRIINTRFSKIEDNKFKVINRNQNQQSNLYDKNNVDTQTRLFKTTDYVPVIDLLNIYDSGALAGGNYTFYIRLADSDYNKTDILAESGIVNIFKGKWNNVNSISGTLQNEKTDKAVCLSFSNLDPAYSYIYIYYNREYCDTNGVRMSEVKMITKPYECAKSKTRITITGNEQTTDLTIDDLNIQYNLVTAVKTQAQVQNMLFFGNVQQKTIAINELQKLSLKIKVDEVTDGMPDLGWVDTASYEAKDGLEKSQTEYYNPINTYYWLGYWPDEIYRLGVVYIMKDNSLSPVMNLLGVKFSENVRSNDADTNEYETKGSFVPNDPNLKNTWGVFKTSPQNVIDYENKVIAPIRFRVTIGHEIQSELEKHNVKGYFFVRQKRIPTTVCQGFSVGIDQTSYIPMPYVGGKYIAESFLNQTSGRLDYSFSSHKVQTNIVPYSGLLSIEANCIPEIKSKLNGEEFLVRGGGQILDLKKGKKERYFATEYKNSKETPKTQLTNTTFIPSDTQAKIVNGFTFATKCGNAEDVSQFSFFKEENYADRNRELIRGDFCPYIGVNGLLTPNVLYTIKTGDYSETKLRTYFEIRGNQSEPFYAISNRYALDSTDKTIDLFRGDCYTNTTSIRIIRNFIDPEVPVNNTIVDKWTWNDNYKGLGNMKTGAEELKDGQGDYSKINRADVNTVPLGMWVTFKCLSTYNLGLRAPDRSHTDEYALMGTPRTFYPYEGVYVNPCYKPEETWLLNQGYGASVGQKIAFPAPDVPYIKELFDNRIMFSDVQTFGGFENSYRIFKSLDYQDIERQYGAIVKLVPWNNNLLCVFEHGVGVLPVNEKALLSTQSGQSVHMYGAGVLQNQISVINPDFGSIWQDSIIRTPVGLYGVDTTAKKIWRVTQQNGFETISDMKIQKFLNEKIKMGPEDKYPVIATKNVKTHYNNFKGDVMFTFYNNGSEWNICYNERMGKWITEYDWIPLCSENVDNIFYSFGKDEQTNNKKGLYIHGQAGVNTREILPCNWYGTQYPFEFEYVCNDQVGMHKIFNNLVIISNNVAPEEIEYIIDGDVYGLVGTPLKDRDLDNAEIIASLDYQNKKAIKVEQDCKDVRKVGRRLGNTQYIEDSWNVQIDPIKYKDGSRNKETRIRDKYVRIRVRYSGKDLAVITALKTIYTQSYA